MPIFVDAKGIQFQPSSNGSYTGVDAEGIQFKFNPSVGGFDVATYGAAGDGTTDDTTAIQNAINAANAAGGGTVLLGAKSYKIDSAITLKSYVQIVGVGYGLTLETSPTLSYGTRLVGNGTNSCFIHNATDGGGQLANGTAVLAACIRNIKIAGIGFTNFTTPIKIGSLYNTGCFESEFRELFFNNCTGWGFRFENCSNSVFSELRSVGTNAGLTGMFYHGTSQTPWNHGNSRFHNLIFDISSPLIRGIVFQANSGSQMNDLNGFHVQCNQTAGSVVTQAATMSNGSANIGVTDGTQFPVDMPVCFSASANGFYVYNTYFVVSQIGNTIKLAYKQGDTANAISATGSSATNVKTYGFPAFELVGYGDNTNSSIQPCVFSGLDLEGHSTAKLVWQKAAANIDIAYADTGQNTVLNTTVCMRSASGSLRAAMRTCIDCDSYSNSPFCNGIIIDPANDPQPFGQAAPLGIFHDQQSGANFLHLQGTGAYTRSLQAQNVNSGCFLYSQMSVGQRTNYSSGTTLTLDATQSGCIVYTGTTNTTWTLPTLVTGAGGTNGASAGLVFEICNGSTTGGVVLTLAAGGSNNFGRQAAKTSYTMALGASISVRANYDGTNPFWQVVGNNGAT